MLSRRAFFRMLGLTSLLPFLSEPSAKQPPPRSVDLLEAPVAGLQYHEGMRKEVFRRLRVNQTLLLVREPENPYDELAIAIRTEDGHKLGYLPSTRNEVPAALADQSVTLRACITAINPHAPPWDRVYVRVWQEV